MRTQTRRLVVGTAAGLALALATPLVPAASAHQGVRGGPESGRHGWHSTSNPATWQARKVLIQSLRAASLALRTQVRAARLAYWNDPAVVAAKATRDGIVRHWNRASTAMYGVPAEAAIGRHFTETLDCGEAADEVSREIEQVWDTGHAIGQCRPNEQGRVKFITDGPKFCRGSGWRLGPHFLDELINRQRSANEPAVQVPKQPATIRSIGGRC